MMFKFGYIGKFGGEGYEAMGKETNDDVRRRSSAFSRKTRADDGSQPGARAASTHGA